MKVTLDRRYKNCNYLGRVYCIGKLYVDGVYVCDTIEDKDWGWTKYTSVTEINQVKARNKGKTAIPRGSYSVTLDVVSPRFSAMNYYKQFCKGKLPRLLNVPGFDGVLFHRGNDERNSEGCIIVGYNTIKGGLTKSKEAFESFYRLLNLANQHHEPIVLEII